MKGTFLASLSGAVRNALIVVAGLTMLTIFTLPASATVHFGVRCEGSFQDNWAPTIDVYDGCANFISVIELDYPVDFYFNLVGAQTDFYYGDGGETCLSCGGVDSVDFFFMSTHGDSNIESIDTAEFAMWENQTWANTYQMRLGDSGKQVKAFATFSCDTLYNADGRFWHRWQSALSGGVKFLAGAHGNLYTDEDDQAMPAFAKYVIWGDALGTGWLNAVYDWNNDNQPTVANTGANKSDCFNRQEVNLNGLMEEPALRDGQIGYYCWTNWN
jgi:Family of unknown function (DUF6345)